MIVAAMPVHIVTETLNVPTYGVLLLNILAHLE